MNEPNHTESVSGNISIICVDDEDVVLRALESQLSPFVQLGHTVEVAESGEEALELLDELAGAGAEVALIISDQIMPGMKGAELLILLHRRLPQTIKILLTGQADTAAVGSAVNDANLYRFMAKPWDGKDLELTVRQALRRYNLDKSLAEHRALVRKKTRELAKVNQAYRARSDYFAAMAHELRTPLGGVLGYAKLLRRKAGLSPKYLTMVESIDRCGRHLLELMEEVLDLARAESGQLHVRTVSTNLEQLLRECIEVVQPTADAKGLVLNVEIDATLPSSLATDALKLRQVLLNLLSNAIKFTPEGHVSLSARGGEGEVLLAVSDSGIGIDEEERMLLFQPYRQATGGQTYGGTGLGLAISKGLVETLGGRIELDSVAGEGSTFRVILPSAGETANTADAAMPSPALLTLYGQLHEAALQGNISGLEALIALAAEQKLLPVDKLRIFEGLCDALDLDGIMQVTTQMEAGKAA